MTNFRLGRFPLKGRVVRPNTPVALRVQRPYDTCVKEIIPQPRTVTSLHTSKLYHMDEPFDPVPCALIRMKHVAVRGCVYLRPAFEICGRDSLGRDSLRNVLD